MSYDISFFTVEGGLSPEESFESKCCSVADQGLPAEDLRRAKQLLERLQNSMPRSCFSEDDESISLDDELTGLQVTFFGGDRGAISFPYWHEDEALNPVLQYIAQVFSILRDAGNFWIQDSQLGCFLELKDIDKTKGYLQEVFACNRKTFEMMAQYFR